MKYSSISSLPLRVWDGHRSIPGNPGKFQAFVYDDRKPIDDMLHEKGLVRATPEEEAHFRNEPRPNPIRCATLVVISDEAKEDVAHVKSIVVKEI